MRRNFIEQDGIPLELLKEAVVSKENESWTFKDGDVKFYLTCKNGRVFFSAMRNKEQ